MENWGTNETAAFENKFIGGDLRMHRCNGSLKLKFKVHTLMANRNVKKELHGSCYILK